MLCTKVGRSACNYLRSEAEVRVRSFWGEAVAANASQAPREWRPPSGSVPVNCTIYREARTTCCARGRTAARDEGHNHLPTDYEGLRTDRRPRAPARAVVRKVARRERRLGPGHYPFEPFPFPALTMTVSLEAIFLALFVLASQNCLTRQADKRSQRNAKITPKMADRHARAPGLDAAPSRHGHRPEHSHGRDGCSGTARVRGGASRRPATVSSSTSACGRRRCHRQQRDVRVEKDVQAFNRGGPPNHDALRNAFVWFRQRGVTVRRVLTDNGSGYKSRRFAGACRTWPLRHRFTRPYTPRTNGMAERFIQPLLMVVQHLFERGVQRWFGHGVRDAERSGLAR